jgi:GDPmannose 4,6-dehydratase
MAGSAIITGTTGQDGSYLVESLLAQGYRVVGHVRTPEQIAAMQTRYPGLEVICFDLSSTEQWADLVQRIQPSEIYHLAGMSFVPDCWENPQAALQANVAVTLGVLEAMRRHSPQSRLFYACSSEVFGDSRQQSMDEQSPLQPQSIYGVTKAASLGMIQSYRQRYGMFVCGGILFNHESPRRDPRFVTRKITQAVASIALGKQKTLALGNLDVYRDWGFAGDYVDAYQRMLRHESPQDFVIGTGRLCSLTMLVDIAFQQAGLKWQDYVVSDSQLARPNDRRMMVADSRKAQELLGWHATTSIESVIRTMVQHDLEWLQGTEGDRRAA